VKGTKVWENYYSVCRSFHVIVLNSILFQLTNAGLRLCQSVARWYAAAVFKTV
jgi:hypothetical protein